MKNLMAKVLFKSTLLTIMINEALSETNISKVFHDVYLTNSTSSYREIPSDCHLFGYNFSRDDPIEKLQINITKADGEFWVGLDMGFQRKVNPIGVLTTCKESNNVVTLDECIKLCENYRYVQHSKTFCNCTNETFHTPDELQDVKPCLQDQDEMGFCTVGCLVYERVDKNEEYTCGSYSFATLPGNRLKWFKPVLCNNKGLNRLICNSGKGEENNMNITWYEALQICRNKGGRLAQTIKEVTKEKIDDGTYWVSFFRRQFFFWGKVKSGDICVAASVTNGTLSYTSKLCTEELSALCFREQDFQTKNGDKQVRSLLIFNAFSMITLIVVCSCSSLIVIVLMVVVSILIRMRVRKKRHKKINIEDTNSENETFSVPLNADTTNNSIPNSSDIFISPTYADVINSIHIGMKSSVGTEYASVVRTKDTTKETKTQQNQIMENPYYIPEF